MLGSSDTGGVPQARLTLTASRRQRLAYLQTRRYYRRKRVREQLRQARRVLTLVRARKGAVISVVSAAIVALVALGATGALFVTWLVHR
jgi:hypothetical protein